MRFFENSWLVGILVALLFSGGCSRELSRDRAMADLSKKFNGQVVYLELHEGAFRSCNDFRRSRVGDYMFQKGWMDYVEVRINNLNKVCVLGLTEDAPSYFREPSAMREIGYWEFSVYHAAIEINVASISGVRIESEITRIVDYEVSGVELVDDAKGLLWPDGAPKGQALFQLFDDGWRLIEHDIGGKIQHGLPEGAGGKVIKGFADFKKNYPSVDDLKRRRERQQEHNANLKAAKQDLESFLEVEFRRAVSTCSEWRSIGSFNCRDRQTRSTFGPGVMTLEVCGDFMRFAHKNCSSAPGGAWPLHGVSAGALWLASVRKIDLVQGRDRIGLWLTHDRDFPALHVKRRDRVTNSSDLQTGTVLFSVEDAKSLTGLIRSELERYDIDYRRPMRRLDLSAEDWSMPIAAKTGLRLVEGGSVEVLASDGQSLFINGAVGVPLVDFVRLQAAGTVGFSYGIFERQAVCRDSGKKTCGSVCTQLCQQVN